MSSVMSVSSPSAGAKARAAPMLCASSSMRHYRRSTTTKAPRKRTFLVTMTKYNDRTAPPAVAAFTNNVAMLTFGPCFEDDAALSSGNGDSGFGGNSNGNNGGNNHGNNGGSGGSSSGDSSRFLPILGQALLGALGIVAAVAVFPAQSSAMQGSGSGSGSPSPATSPASTFLGGAGSPKDSLLSSSAPSAGRAGILADVPVFGRTSSPSRPRSKVMHVPCKGSTLVVPLTGSTDPKAPRLGPWQRAKIVDAPIVLSGNEVSVLELPQYRVRESMLV